MAAIFPSPAAGCRMAPTCSRWSPNTELYPESKNSIGSAQHDATTSRVWFGILPAGIAAGARGAHRRTPRPQGGAVGNEGRQDRCGARDDDAALYRRDHRPADEHRVLADVEGNLFQERRTADRDRL